MPNLQTIAFQEISSIHFAATIASFTGKFIRRFIEFSIDIANHSTCTTRINGFS